MAAPSSSTLYFGKKEEIQSQTHQQPSSTITSSTTPTAAPQKKRRNQPGNPNPDAEVVALSPKTLMATNRFICEVCNKGFQREQNLQLHRRGHNLPWKLKQKSKKEPKRKVYLCPEPTCVHHDPSRALGDLTGIKKHYSRKHGEKKWKCEKCSKRYAVQSDWKAHSKTCGTREYRCDCGTLFSRRDSFITHRAFCDALAQESARHPTSLNTMGSHHLFGNNHMSLGLSQVGSQNPPLHNPNHPSSNMLRLGSSGSAAKFEHLIPPSSPFGQPRQPMPPSSALFNMPDANQSFPNKQLHGLMQLPDLQNSSNNSPQATNLFNLGFFSNNSSSMGGINGDHANFSSSGLLMQDQLNNGNGGGGHGTALFSSGNMGHHNGGSCVSSLYGSSMHPDNIDSHMSATALLQKAAQIGSNSSSNNSSLLRSLVSSSSSTPTYDKQNALASFGINFGSGHGGIDHQNLRSHMENESHLQGLMNSLANAGSSIFVGGQGQDNNFGGFNGHRNTSFSGVGVDEEKLHQNLAHVSFGGSDKLTLDFLGVGGMVRNLGGGYSQTDQQQQHAMNMSSLEPGLNTNHAGSQPFGSTTLQ
ncbi:hypothetical protein I3842_05G159300 [Carya illinoinensis]|uniref:C2H2-type domain-containing protein n=1 Tax=Carya illinoinensis TaxID=32201 RepID=A0A922F1G2_CARIL|nr:hypothetical protein I3842_05G159300 [Carya illinoinensis]KAG6713565.1 hypothetical protein I3842_05G159300 [Carya illinoinensis]